MPKKDDDAIDLGEKIIKYLAEAFAKGEQPKGFVLLVELESGNPYMPDYKILTDVPRHATIALTRCAFQAQEWSGVQMFPFEYDDDDSNFSDGQNTEEPGE